LGIEGVGKKKKSFNSLSSELKLLGNKFFVMQDHL